MSQTKYKQFVIILLKYSNINEIRNLTVDSFKQFIRKELVEKFHTNKNNFYNFREELCKLFHELDIKPIKPIIKVSNSYKRYYNEINSKLIESTYNYTEYDYMNNMNFEQTPIRNNNNNSDKYSD